MPSRATLPAVARLHRAADFTALRHAPGRANGALFMFRYAANAAGLARLGMAVSRKVSLRAVDRNRIKRLVRQSFRHARSGLPAVDVLVIARPAARDAVASGILGDLGGLWRRLAALNPPAGNGTMAD